MGRTPKVVEDRQQQIMDAALRVFARKGYSGATNKDIAQEAGITPGLIYHYFESKQALFKAIIETNSPVRIARSPQPEILRAPPETALRLLVRQILAVVENEEFIQVMRVFLPEAIHNPKVAPLGSSAIQEANQFLIDYLDAKMESGELRQKDATLAAQIIIGSIMALMLRRHVLRDPEVLKYTQEEIADHVVEMGLHGLLPC